MIDSHDLDGYELVHDGECSSGDGHFGVKIFVLRPQATRDRIAALPDPPGVVELTPLERERLLFLGVGRDAMRLLEVQARRLDPAVAERAARARADFERAFADAGLGPIFVEEIPNGYWGACSADAVGRPWYRVTTRIGRIVVGWRKGVIEIDWSDSTVTAAADELFPEESVTKDGWSIHAWELESAVRYLGTIARAAGQDGGTREIWVVEHRERFLDQPGRLEESVVMHVASTRDLAIAWCKANLKAGGERIKPRPWWFAITRETVDSDEILEDNQLTIVHWDGEVRGWQPVNGYEAEEE